MITDAAFKALWAKPLSIRQVMKEAGMTSTSSAAYRAQRLGLPNKTTTRGRKVNQDKAATAREMRAAGYSFRKIAATLNTVPSSVHNWCKSA